jgi:hypothetical protein
MKTSNPVTNIEAIMIPTTPPLPTPQASQDSTTLLHTPHSKIHLPTKEKPKKWLKRRFSQLP